MDLKLVAYLENDTSSASVTFTFSVPKYSAKLLKNGTAVEKELARDVLAYVKAAYNYFTELNTPEEIARVNALVESVIGNYSGAPVLSGVTNIVAPVTKVTLNLDAKPTIRFYVSDTNVSFYINGKKLNTVKGNDELYGAYLELDVYAYALSETITYGEGGSYHVSSFVNGAEGTDYEMLVKAFVKYTESAGAYRNAVLDESDFVPTAEVVNKNGAAATVTFVIDDGDQDTATFGKKMLLEYTELSLTFAVPVKKLATLQTSDDDGDGIPNYVMVNGKYVYEINEQTVEFWNDILIADRTEIVNHSYTHGFFGSNDDGGSFEYVKNNQTTVIKSEIMPVGSVTKEIYASKQILEDLFGDYLSDNGTMITYIGAGIGVRTKDYTLEDGTVIKTYKTFLDERLQDAYDEGDLIGVSSTFGQNYTPGFNFASKVVTAENFTEELRLAIPRYMIESYNANPEGIANGDISNWIEFIDAAIELNGWANFCIHKIRKTLPESTSDHLISEDQAELLFKYASENNIWVATNSDAIMYYSEWSTAKVDAELVGDEIKVTLTDEEDNSIYNMALTVKISVPASWGSVIYNGESIEVARNSDGTGYVLVDIVPDSGTVSLVKGE